MTRSRRHNKYGKKIILLISISVLVIYWSIWAYKIIKKDQQLDFQTYYYAGTAYLEGENPYLLSTLMDLSTTEIDRPFLYPPITLNFFAPFSMFSYEVSFIIYLMLKLLCLAMLIFLWHKYFLKTAEETIILIVSCLLAFHETILIDIVSGNIVIFEQLVLWTGIIALLKRRSWIFPLAILVTAQFKLMPILLIFLGLTLPHKERKEVFYFLPIGFIISIIMQLLVWPELSMYFLNNLGLPNEIDSINPSAFSLFQELSLALAGKGSYILANIHYVLYSLLFGGIILVIFLVWKRIKETNKLELFIMFLLTAYALLSPRFKDYSYVLLIVPSVYILVYVVKNIYLRIFLGFIFWIHLFEYQNLLALFIMFCLYSNYFVRAPTSKKGSHMDFYLF